MAGRLPGRGAAHDRLHDRAGAHRDRRERRGAAGLFPRVREKLIATMAGYGALPEHAADDFVVPAGLGGLAGPAGALVLAENALYAG